MLKCLSVYSFDGVLESHWASDSRFPNWSKKALASKTQFLKQNIFLFLSPVILVF